MKMEAKPLAEITHEAIQVLYREIGVANTMRVINQFTKGYGNYTETQARRKALRCLRDVAGYLLRTGKPIFEPERLTWRVPVVPNLKRGIPEPIGELRLSAETGEVFTEEEAISKMVDCAMPLFGVRRMADDFQNRLDSLMTRHNNGDLTQGEQKELAQMVATLETHDLENLRRLVENVRLPARKRDEASVREKQVKILSHTSTETAPISPQARRRRIRQPS